MSPRRIIIRNGLTDKQASLLHYFVAARYVPRQKVENYPARLVDNFRTELLALEEVLERALPTPAYDPDPLVFKHEHEAEFKGKFKAFHLKLREALKGVMAAAIIDSKYKDIIGMNPNEDFDASEIALGLHNSVTNQKRR